MSKTGDEGIALSDDADTVRDRIKRAVTDSGKEIRFDEKEKPAISNLLTIYSLLSGKGVKDIETQYADANGYAKFKEDLAEVIVEFLKPFQAKYKELKADPKYVAGVLAKSEEKARIIASSNLQEFKQKMGLE
jgi:tryptophanyl-tRNA synthetase